ncbi:uncharacterized protein BT62DRAFT_996683 [Guyanagaster necrorhizus]|uniref:Ubiquitin 3 binding protein But2 C-terminal domain-containing protein n=1 Tax=Guyanagaster necrorhizus TaxID=856835 RepID=A0A9P7VJJ3_9AGAR|nr:uncharacterized protein BT62DRAFT_996683 [Guyanagaster necrorhizus MCA 3950]KAG7442306.1 hypothetical protein BT62DRAFT_996683 [Guyanagaster necrorhizus MCA 3950]
MYMSRCWKDLFIEILKHRVLYSLCPGTVILSMPIPYISVQFKCTGYRTFLHHPMPLTLWKEPIADDTSVGISDVNDTAREKATSCWSDHLVMWTSIGVLCSFLTTLLLTILIVVKFAPSMLHGSAIIQAGRHSQYIHFDSVFLNNNHDRNASHHTSIVNFPDIVPQVETYSPGHLVQEWPTELGTVFPDHRYVVSSDTSTVLQFYHLDYGMQYCSLALSIPPPSDGFDLEVKIENNTVMELVRPAHTRIFWTSRAGEKIPGGQHTYPLWGAFRDGEILLSFG